MISFGFIIPTHNSSQFIVDCLNSINNQEVSNEIKIIVVDDYSKDNTIKLIDDFSFNQNISIEVYHNEKNERQGYSRNFALDKLDTDYVMFLDSDDFIASDTLQRLNEVINKKAYDIVFIDWIYYDHLKGKYNYVLNDKLLSKESLSGNQCADILSFKTYFTTPAFYNLEYLKNNNIRYGEGYIYEDYEFMVMNAMQANDIFFIHYPLYIVRINENSTTKVNYDTTLHYDSFKKAISQSLKYLNNRNTYSIYYFYEYTLKKLLNYAYYRIPKKYRKKLIREVVALLSINKDYPIPKDISTFNHFVFDNHLIEKRNTSLIIYKYRRIRFGLFRRKLNKKFYYKMKNYDDIEVINGKIVLVGFDFEDKGNSKYLYQYLRESHYDNFVFVKKDNDLNYHLNSAEFIIFESWNNVYYRKKENQKFIQLWHGSPLKRIAFASNEIILLERNPNSRVNKFKDYQRWDYLLVDNPNDKKVFDECFPYHNYQYLECGYPRVKYLVDNQDNQALINQIKRKYHITKPLVLYVPTWRDSQLISEDKDWLLNIQNLKTKYPEYQFLSFEHAYLNDNREEVDIQDLILVSDVIISDYSSIIFDGVAINKKIILYQKDLNQFKHDRGLFESQLEWFKNNIVYNPNDLEKLLEDFSLIPDVKIENEIDYRNTYQQILSLIKK